MQQLMSGSFQPNVLIELATGSVLLDTALSTMGALWAKSSLLKQDQKLQDTLVHCKIQPRRCLMTADSLCQHASFKSW